MQPKSQSKVRIPNIFDCEYEVVSSELVGCWRDIHLGTGKVPDVRMVSYVVEVVRIVRK